MAPRKNLSLTLQFLMTLGVPWLLDAQLQSLPPSSDGLHFHFHALEKEMATHSSTLAWRIPGTEEPGGLPSMGLYRVGHN